MTNLYNEVRDDCVTSPLIPSGALVASQRNMKIVKAYVREHWDYWDINGAPPISHLSPALGVLIR